MEQAPNQTESSVPRSFLPDFCQIGMVFVVVMGSQLLAILLVLADTRPFQWDRLGLVSLFVQLVALSSASLLCVLGPLLARLPNRLAALLSYSLILLVTLVYSEISFRLDRSIGLYYSAGHWKFLLHNLGISAIISFFGLRILYLQHQQQQALQAQSEARIQALQARIRPHFLFNSMNTIAALIPHRPQEAEEAIADLSDLFRASLKRGDRPASLSEEVDLARHYLHMEQLRLGDRLQVDWQLAELPQDLTLPPLCLQPLLENAVYHGIETLPQGGLIQIHGTRQGKLALIEICNPRAADTDSRHEGHGIALNNIRERLRMGFGRTAGLEIDETAERFCVKLRLPLTE